MNDIMLLKPELKSMIWGGNKLKSIYGLDIPTDTTGEDWTASGHPSGDCQILNGPYKGETVSQVWKEHPELFGNYPSDVFPLLAKIIDARQDLSIQCHPDDAYAKKNENGALGKTECWYVLDADPGTTIITGHSAKTKDELCKMIDNGEWDKLLVEKPCNKGDFFMIEPGTLHAIKGGTLIYELQQSSDKTYRIYDYGRLQNGKPRELHTQKAKDVLVCPTPDTSRVPEDIPVEGGKLTRLGSSAFFTAEKLEVQDKVILPQDRYFTMLTVAEGDGTIDGEKVAPGTSALIPAGDGDIVITGPMTVMIGTPEKKSADL
ncbi:MAG: type I phosphomannose isomerase catalytic subunit [Eubacteriaceae bacterium]|jgi:mannose-6-phosphate isomerase